MPNKAPARSAIFATVAILNPLYASVDSAGINCCAVVDQRQPTS